MSNIISSCRVSLTGSKIIIARESTSGTRRSNCLQEPVPQRHLRQTFKMTWRRARPGATCSGTSPREASHLYLRISEVPLAILTGSSNNPEEVALEAEAVAMLAVYHSELATSATRRVTWRRTAPTLTRARGDSMAVAGAPEAVTVTTSQRGEAAEIKR